LLWASWLATQYVQQTPLPPPHCPGFLAQPQLALFLAKETYISYSKFQAAKVTYSQKPAQTSIISKAKQLTQT
jgi:hypothetical protein